MNIDLGYEREFLQLSEQIYAVLDHKGCFLDVSESWGSKLNWRKEETIGKSFLDFIHPEDRVNAIIYIQELLSGEKEESPLLVRLRTSNEDFLYIKLKASYCDIKKHILAVLTDNSSLVHTQETLAEKIASLEEIQESAKVGSWFYDVHTHEIKWSKLMYTIFAEDEKKGEPSFEEHYESVHPDDREDWSEVITQCGEDGLPYETLFRAVHPDGKIVWVQSNGRGIFDDRGELTALMGTCQDVTYEINKQLELEEAKQKAEDLAKAKSVFLANMSHEIRTPLNGIVGMIEILQMSEIKKENKEYLKIMNDASMSLSELLNDILDISKIESGKLQLLPERNSVDKALNEVVLLMRPLATKKFLNLRLILEEDVKESAVFDYLRFKQIVINLVSNAVKFTPMGEVTIKAYRRDKLFHLDVIDTGIGIAQEHIGSLFESFQQVDQGIQKTFGGSGLGLAITKKLAQMMGGDIAVESNLDQGSVFQVTLPLKFIKAPKKEKAKESKEDLRLDKLRILIVEDNEINQKVICALIKRLGAEYELCVNGEEAVERMAHNNKFDVILMDIQMPIMDGYTATKKIRDFNKEIPIIALTANAFSEHKKLSIEVGMDDFLTKPIKKEALILSLKKHCRAKA